VLSIGNGNMVFGRVVAIHVAERVWADGRIDALRMAPVGRLSGSAYTPTTEVFKIPRRSWEDLRTEER
jgi:flavin reductase (DIM6/NTAB) family NADH-FMN oxidoreductase RutF